MIDLHSHVLPGVDDGAGTLAESIGILRAAAEDGITRIAATPHVRADYPTSPNTMERGVDELNRAAREAGVPIEVLAGGELDIEYAARLDDATLARFGLGGNAAVLLLECPYYGWPLDLRDVVFRLATRGFSVVLGHPERNPDVQADPELLRPLVDAGVLVQLTAASVDGRVGSSARHASRALLDAGLAHLIASDAHAPQVRAVGMSAAAAAVGDAALAQWLTEAVPAAVVSGSEVPARPKRPQRRRLGLRWRP
ncbi:MAG TPA: CpsB/CapC family capsule biosynthesis tyrosine phosphatase [Gaiellaceae bacterium]